MVMRPVLLSWLRRGLIVAAAMALSGWLAQSALYARINAWLNDAQQRALATELDFREVIVIDVDEESIRRLAPELGSWPYGRDVYSLVTAYLLRSGVAVVAYDILFAEPRDGDDAFRSSLDARVVLAAAALPNSLERSAAYHRQLAVAAIDVQPFDDHSGQPGLAVRGERPPRYDWADLTLPVPSLTGATPARIGVISVRLDDDGVLRRVPTLHMAHGKLLPSLPLAAVMTRLQASSVSYVGGMLHAGSASWPVAVNGDVLLRYPANEAALRVIPFYEAVLAAAGTEKFKALADGLRGKTVFLGSSSMALSDYALTPMGQLSGLHVAALVHQLLLHNHVIRPAWWPWDSLLLAAGLLPGILGTAVVDSVRIRRRLAALLLTIALTVSGGMLLLALGWASAWFFALTAAVLTHAFMLAVSVNALQRERQRLYYEGLAAQEASRLKGEFLTHMTHELRTPLTAIIGFNKINLLDGGIGRIKRIKNSTIISHSCEHLLQLVNDNLDQARMEAGQLAIVPAPEDVAGLVGEVAATLTSIAEEKGLELQTRQVRPIPARVMIDGFRLRQVLINLVGNALRFTEKGSVKIDLDWRADTLELVVADTGPGMSEDALKRIFDAFQQADVATEASRGGTGLGLAITRNLVHLMGGQIEVKSRVAAGSRFRVEVPAPIAPSADTRPAVNSVVAATTLRGRVLLAEDNVDIRALLVRQLTRLGLEVTAVSDGLAAVQAARAAPADLILMDLEMPVMNGFEAVQVLRAEGYHLPILALTAHGEGAEADRARSTGCDGVVSKPVQLDTLIETLRGVLPAGHEDR